MKTKLSKPGFLDAHAVLHRCRAAFTGAFEPPHGEKSKEIEAALTRRLE